ncbi:histone deacetylase domain-containing protein [Limtongia smithiae]|uniref:histone deacetylase domain-containing protein n=1 Tax=Limtongia smithiae TaxID=1125753 RepID=UPI0034CF2290
MASSEHKSSDATSQQHAPFPSFSFTDLLNSDGSGAAYGDQYSHANDAMREAEQVFLDQAMSEMSDEFMQKILSEQPLIPNELVHQLWNPSIPIQFESDLGHDPLAVLTDPSFTAIDDLDVLTDNLSSHIANLNLDQEHINEERPKSSSTSEPATSDSSDKTLVLLSPLSYLHAFSRKWVAKRYLASIVERPQRLTAAAIGISAAIVLLGAENFVLESSTRTTPLSSADHVKKIHGSQWPGRLRQLCLNAGDKLKANEIEVPDDWNSGDIYLSEGTITALEGVVGAVETGIDAVFDDRDSSVKRCFISVRPPGHHSHPCTPSGFCLINNVHVGIQYAGAKHGLTHAIILDFDLHHGDGSQDICWKLSGMEDQNDEFYADGEADTKASASDGPKIGYFSMHDINSFPTEVDYASPEHIKNASTCVMAHNLCIWNVHLEPYSTKEEYDQLYSSHYSELFARARKFLLQQRSYAVKNESPFKAGVFLSSGFDASEYEDKGMQRHGVHLPVSFYSQFTRDSVKLADEFCEGRVVSLLEGGYSDAAICSGVMSHLVGLQGGEWKDEYGSKQVVTQLVKGCKPNWAMPKTAAAKEAWFNRAIALGRPFTPDGAAYNNRSTIATADATPTGRMNLRERRSTPVYLQSPRTTSRVASPLVKKTTEQKYDDDKYNAHTSPADRANVADVAQQMEETHII